MTSNKPKIISAAIIGNILEYYDFAIYAVFAAKIGEAFFPASSELSQILKSLSIYAVGFLIRPFGGFVFGFIGDRYGRKKSLTSAITIMALATLSMGLIPSYASIGVLAPVLLVLLRLLQGLSISGEGAGAAIFILEHLHKFRPGFIGGIITASNVFGALIATCIGILINLTPLSAGYGWRIAFISGGLIGFAGLYLRLKSAETEIFQELAKKNLLLKSPLRTLLTYQKMSLFKGMCLGGIAGATAYIALAYTNVYFYKTLHLSEVTSLLYMAIAACSYIIFLFPIGICSDKIGYQKTLTFMCMITVVLAIPAFMMIGSDQFTVRAMGLTLIGMFAAGFAPAYPYLFSLFTAEQRATGMGFSFNTGIGIFGGLAPIISVLLTTYTDLLYAPAFYLMLLASFFVISSKFK